MNASERGLIDRYFDDELVHSDTQDLEPLLNRDMEAHEYFVSRAVLSVNLRRSLQRLGLEQQAMSGLAIRKAIGTNPSEHGLSMPGRIVSWSLMSIAMVGLIIGSVAIWSRSANHPKPSHSSTTLVLANHCEWGNGAHFREGERLPVGLMRLVQGRAILRFGGGGLILMEGEVACHLETNNQFELQSGELIVEADEGVSAFTVTMPGLEFKSNAAKAIFRMLSPLHSEVHVLDGELTVTQMNEPAVPPMVLEASQARAFDSGIVKPIHLVANNPSRAAAWIHQSATENTSDQLIAYEGFDYEPGESPVEELNGGAGWSTTWTTRPKYGSSPWGVDNSSSMLNVTGRLSSQWGLSTGSLGMWQTTPGIVLRKRHLVNPIPLDQDGVTYFSLTMHEPKHPPTIQRPSPAMRLSFRNSEVRTPDPVCFELYQNMRPRIDVCKGSIFTSPVVLESGRDLLWVGKIVSRADGDDELFFKVYSADETVDLLEPSEWHVKSEDFQSDLLLDTFALGSLGKQPRLIDEIRIGTCWRTVVPSARFAQAIE
jgi:hypothetical protein